LTRLGFKQGGTAGYGLQRVLLDKYGFTRCILAPGDRKALISDRLQPGRSDEVKTERRVFRSFVVDGKSEYTIAHELNEERILNEFGRPWPRPFRVLPFTLSHMDLLSGLRSKTRPFLRNSRP
jgi:hypothetical protein